MTSKFNRLYPEMRNISLDFLIENNDKGVNYLINGEIISHQGKGIEVYSPLQCQEEGKVVSFMVGSYPALGRDDALQALKAAKRAHKCGMGIWPQMMVEERIACVEEFLTHIKPLKRDFALLEMWEIGKTYSGCLDEFQRTIEYIELTINKLKELQEQANAINTVGDFIYQVRRCPLGLTLCMGPFNYPLNETFAMLMPALLMGNSIIMKPPKYGALCLTILMDAFAKCFPPGVVNIINGDGAEIIGPLMESGDISVLGFIGSTRVANILIQQHPNNNRLRTILGLEAKNPAFVFPDADLDLTVSECIKGALEFNGQRCTAIKHIWVHEKILDAFLSLLSQEIGKLEYGMPWEENVMLTPLPEEGKTSLLNALVVDAVEKGAEIVNPGGGEITGNFFYPAVLYPVKKNMKIYNVEQFGPIIPVSSFSQLDELLNYMAFSDYGQQASIFSSSPEYTAPLIDYLVNQVSRINLNSQCRRGPDELPFTGRKDSAEGTLSVTDALRAFSIRSLVVANETGRELFLKTIQSGKSKFLRI